MLLLQSGFPKSGNFWLYSILQKMLQQAGIPSKSYAKNHPIYAEARSWPYFEDQAGIDYLEIEPHNYVFRKGAYTEKIPDIEVFLEQCTHVWTHSYWIPGIEPVFQKFDKIIYILRDPRDVVVSASKFMFSPFMEAQHKNKEASPDAYLQHRFSETLLSWVQHVGGYLQHADEYHIQIVFYERLLQNLPTELELLSRYLEIDLDENQIEDICSSVNFHAMKAKNPFHVRKGKAYQWANILSERQIERAEQITGPLIDYLGYPDFRDAQIDHLPELPEQLDPELIQKMLDQSRGDLKDKFWFAYEYFSSKRPLQEKFQKGLEYLFSKGRWKSQ